MMKDAAWLAPGGWREKAIVELDLVLNQKKAMVPRTHQEYLRYVKQYGNRVKRLNIMALGSIKVLADGTPGRCKVRNIVTDVKKKDGSTYIGPTFSPTVDAETVRFLTAATLGRPGLKRRILDVQAAYYLGDVATPENG